MEVSTVYEGDCLEVMEQLPGNCIDAIITDPPYGLSFIGKGWDHCLPGVAYWREALRVAKPGAYLLAFGGTRTYHRLACAIEDAGWEIRDCVTYLNDGNQVEAAFMASLNDEQLAAYLELYYPAEQIAWVYGQGMGLGHDISKGLDKAAIVDCQSCGGSGLEAEQTRYCSEHGEVYGADFCPICDADLETEVEDTSCQRCGGSGKVRGAEREVIDSYKQNGYLSGGGYVDSRTGGGGTKRGKFATGNIGYITAPATPLAAKFSGYRSRLKPAFEPIVVAMKPIDGTYAHNAERWGLAGLNIDGCRVETTETEQDLMKSRMGKWSKPNTNLVYAKGLGQETSPPHNLGRYPANLTHSGESGVMAEFAKAGVRVSNVRHPTGKPKMTGSLNNSNAMRGSSTLDTTIRGHNDSGSAARFFAVCPPDLPRFIYQAKAGPSERKTPGNNHPTQKPLELLKYLVKLCKPPDGGVILDPFAGSGTTALACISEGADYILIEKEPEYCEIIRRRIAEYTGQEIAPKEIEINEQEKVRQMSLW